MRILILLLLFQSLVFSADLQTCLSVSLGSNITFSTAKHSFYEQYNGFRVGVLKLQ